MRGSYWSHRSQQLASETFGLDRSADFTLQNVHGTVSLARTVFFLPLRLRMDLHLVDAKETK